MAQQVALSRHSIVTAVEALEWEVDSMDADVEGCPPAEGVYSGGIVTFGLGVEGELKVIRSVVVGLQRYSQAPESV